MHLLMGHPSDPCCAGVSALLEAQGCPVRIIASPLAHPTRLVWRLSGAECSSVITLDDGLRVPGDQIAGVLVRNAGWIDPTGWDPADLGYIQAETQAALLAWVWSLACPVVNRPPSAVWYRPRPPLLSWQRLLRQSGLPTPEVLLTNVAGEARAFGRRLADEGVAGVVYGPLTAETRYLIEEEADWRGLAVLQGNVPVSLSYPHGATRSVCVVGGEVVWEGARSAETTAFEPGLRRFAAATGLAFVELAFAPTRQGMCVMMVEPNANFEHFGEAARTRIVEGIVQLLTTQSDQSRERRGA